MTPSKTLRELNALDASPANLANATLVLVDYQNTYTHGVMELTGWKPALEAASALLARARAAGTKIIHVMHDGGAGSAYDITEDIGQIHASVAPMADEAVVVKQAPNSFVGTNLGEPGGRSRPPATHHHRLHDTYVRDIHGRGSLSARQPANHRGRCLRHTPLRSAVADVEAKQLHHCALATIADLYGVVVPSGAALH